MGLVGRRAEPLEELANELRESGGDAIACPADVSSPEEAAAAIDAAVEQFGGIDALVNNAAVGDSRPAQDEIANVIAFLASPAAAYVTGATTVVDPTAA